MELFNIIIKISSVATAIGVVIKSLEKIINKIFKPIEEKINYLDYNQCQNYLVDFLSDLEDNIKKNECQYKRAYEIYDHYLKIGGNSYIKDKWEKLVK